MLPWHGFLSAERGFSERPLGRPAGDAAQVDAGYAGGVGGAKERADVVQAADVIEQDGDRQCGDSIVRGGGFGGLKRNPVHVANVTLEF